jgi:hypothetical protein
MKILHVKKIGNVSTFDNRLSNWVNVSLPNSPSMREMEKEVQGDATG